MNCNYVKENPKTVQKLANAFVRTLKWIYTHSAAEIAAKMPADYDGGDPELYEKSIKDSSPMFTTDGVMPDGGRRPCSTCSARSRRGQGEEGRHRPVQDLHHGVRRGRPAERR